MVRWATSFESFLTGALLYRVAAKLLLLAWRGAGGALSARLLFTFGGIDLDVEGWFAVLQREQHPQVFGLAELHDGGV